MTTPSAVGGAAIKPKAALQAKFAVVQAQSAEQGLRPRARALQFQMLRRRRQGERQRLLACASGVGAGRGNVRHDGNLFPARGLRPAPGGGVGLAEWKRREREAEEKGRDSVFHNVS